MRRARARARARRGTGEERGGGTWMMRLTWQTDVW